MFWRRLEQRATIAFVASTEAATLLEPPRAAARSVPQWWKQFERRRSAGSGFPTSNAKYCMPFVDAITAGYLLALPEALHVVSSPGEELVCSWRRAELGARVESHDARQLPDELHGVGGVWKFVQPWGRLSKSASMLYTHPFNRHDLPFRSFSGIVDGGYSSAVNVPFVWIAGHGEFLIDAGTPIAQLLPFTRAEWSARVESRNEHEVIRTAFEQIRTWRVTDVSTTKLRRIADATFRGILVRSGDRLLRE